MLPRLVAVLLVAMAVYPAAAQPLPASRAGDVEPAPDLASAFEAIVEQVVTPDGRVRYDLLRGRLQADFRRVLKAVEMQDPARLTTRSARLAFWINAYNVQMLQNVVAAPDVRHIMDDGAAERFFRTPLRTAGLAMTLDALEHVILRRQPGPAPLVRHRLAALDPRIHVGLHCGAVSCPPLRAYRAHTVDAQLDAAMRHFVSSPTFLRQTEARWVLSSLLDWFADDFDRPGQPGGDYLLRHLSPERPDADALRRLLNGRRLAALRSRTDVRYAYDWRVNDAAL